MGQRISLAAAAAEPSSAYMALPTGAQGPGLLLLHAWWGLTGEFEGLANRFAKEGFLTLCPDYYAGATVSTIEDAMALRSKLDRDRVNMQVTASLHYLLSHPKLAGKRVATVGFSLGASFAIDIARAHPDVIDAVVLFYGIGIGKFDNVKTRFLGHFAENDQWGADAKEVASLEKRLQDAEIDFKFHIYPDTEHWFFERNQQKAYNPEAAEWAWHRTIGFLRKRLLD